MIIIQFNMQIWVKTLSAKKCSLNFDKDSTVLHIKQYLEENEGIEVAQIRLIYQGKQLDDSATLSDCGVDSGATLRVHGPGLKGAGDHPTGGSSYSMHDRPLKMVWLDNAHVQTPLLCCSSVLLYL